MKRSIVLALAVLGCAGDPSGPPPPTQLAFVVQPAGAVAGDPFAPVQVGIRDAAGMLVSNATDAVTLALGVNPGGGTLAGVTTVSAENGVATFSGLSLEKAGTGYTLVASSATLAGATSAAFSVAPGPPIEIAFTAQPPATVEVNAALAPAVAVTIKDEFDNLAAGAVTLSLGNNPGSATLQGAVTVDAVAGLAVFEGLRVTKSGSGYTLLATAGTITAPSAPFDVNFPLAFVHAGGSHTCGLTPSGAAYCWGNNFAGPLGDGTTTSSAKPVLVKGGHTFIAISAGSAHTCGIVPGGAAYCWGGNQFGQLGDGGTSGSTVPVHAAEGRTFATVSAGFAHTCGVTTAGEGFCWGDNGQGQLGDGTTTSSNLPVAISGGYRFAEVIAGAYYSCGVQTAATGSAAYCWGQNDAYGQLGTGTMDNSLEPAPVGGGHSFVSVSGRIAHTCGMTTAASAAAYCWGAGGDGNLGDGLSSSTTTPVLVAEGDGYTVVGAGGVHTCGIRSGTLYCWGYNASGQLGNGTTGSASTPVAVSGGHAFASVSVGNSHACGVVSGVVYCWGFNGQGQLGNGTTSGDAVSTPVRVVDP